MAVGKSGRKDGLRRSPVGLNFGSIDDNVSISSISDVAGQCFTGSPGNAPTLDTFNSFSPLSDSATECRMTHEGVTPLSECNTTRDSTPLFTSSSRSEFSKKSSIKQSYKNVKTPKPPRNVQFALSTSSTVQVPDGGYLSEYLSATSVTLNSAYISGEYINSHFYVPIILGGLRRSIRATAMVDSGALGLFMHRRFAERHGAKVDSA